jgi:hypothetical protein|nr:MAG TPA: DNL zinc finger protein [Caudoviricetes sp.]
MRLIDADTICEGMVEGWQTVLIKAQVDNAPTVDAVVVVRCKDCKHLVAANVNGKGIPTCRVSGMEIAPDEFCSRGEKGRR